MNLTLSVNHDRLILQLDALKEATQADSWDIVKDETRALSKTMVNFVPPLKANGDPKIIGEGAVERDIKNLISEASPEFIDEVGSRYGIVDIDAWITQKDGTRLNLQWEHVDPTGARLDEYHRSYLVQGRVPKVKGQFSKGRWKSRVVAPPGARDSLIERKKLNVGRWKASWAFAAAELGATFPRWLSRHFGVLNDVAIFEPHYDAKSPTITFGSRAAGNFRIQSDLRTAFNVRIKAIRNRIKLIASGYSKDVSSGIKIARKANQIKTQDEPNVEA